MLKSVCVAFGLFLVATVAFGQDTKAYKITASIKAGNLKGVPCVLRANGATLEFTTPGKIVLPVDSSGAAILESLSCTFQGQTNSTENFADSRTVRVDMNFQPPGRLIGPVVFYKSNGGVSAFIDTNGRLATVG